MHNGPETLLTFVLVTTPPNALIARITDPMPAILPRETWATWLSETDAPLSDAKSLLQTYEDGVNWTMEPQTSTRPARPPNQPTSQPAKAEGTGRTVLGVKPKNSGLDQGSRKS